MHIFDFRWDDALFQPYFQYIEGKEVKKYFLEKENPFSITLSRSDIHCVGHMRKGEYSPCPQNAQGVKKCEICKKAEDYFPCQFCNGFNCDRFRAEKIENCDADHMVYLALFAPDLVKVGVSRLSRMKARQFEQGTHFTRIFAQGMTGIMARRVESFLGKLGFPDKIPSTRKKDILFPEITLEEGKFILQEKFEFAKENLHHQMPQMMKNIVDNEFWDMRQYYSLDFEALQNNSKPVHFLDLEEGESVGGILKAIKGSFLVIETDTELVILLAKKFVGKHLSFEECPQGITKNGGFQGGFF